MGQGAVFLQAEVSSTRHENSTLTMKIYILLFAISGAFLSLPFVFLQKKLVNLSEKDSCKFCYGFDLCKEFESNKIILQYNSLSDFIFNIISVKNVFFARYFNERVVIKKLGTSREIAKLDKLSLNGDLYEKIVQLLQPGDLKDFSVCREDDARKLVDNLLKNKRYNLNQIWTFLQINAEPLLLKIFEQSHHWPVPKLYGFCGRLMMESNCGVPLLAVENYGWFDRAFIAYQLLKAAVNFTKDHQEFQLYFTDISPDNVAVDEKLKISFIDLENAVLTQNSKKIDKIHYSEHFMDEGFVFNPKDFCSSSISDHNIYSVCSILLSNNTSWPMMANGLLHNAPKKILQSNRELFENIELCVYSQDKLNRFDLCTDILLTLRKVLMLNNKDNKYLFID